LLSNLAPASNSIGRKSRRRAPRSAQDGHSPTEKFQRAHSEKIKTISAYLRKIGLFDEGYYIDTYPDVADSELDAFEHFFLYGYREGRRPNPSFDPNWYLATYPDVKSSEFQPLLHYAQFGEQEGRRPAPYFDPTWYRKKYNVPAGQNALAHYLKHRFGPFSPMPEFDAEYYLAEYKDVAVAGVDPFEHYIHIGYCEGRNPSTEFDTKFYVQRYLKGKADQNPLLHYREHRNEEGIFPRPPENDATIPSQIKRFTKPGAHFEELRPLPASSQRRAKVLAYYLPQFHAFPENDRWWGTGFTEWTNVARGLPRFKDHYQPRIPRDLGFYSLEQVETIRKQVGLAKAAGVHAFVFYYYWFNGKRLLERPLEQFLKSSDIDMPFCLMWANENWTRRWDGLEGEVLISQGYRANDDQLLINDFARHFADPRYVRLQGRPLLMIYRPSLIPDASKVIARWRSLIAERFGENPIIVMGQSFDDNDPRIYGMDGAIEFPPHKITKNIPLMNADVQILDETFSGQVYKYDDVIKSSLDEVPPGFPLIKTVVPSWDNDARRQGTGLVIHGSTPTKYETWLSALVERARHDTFFGESIVCINAWNEWCEGAYLEPDLHFGSAYLNATGRAVTGLTHDASCPRLLLVGHDAFPSGAQQLLLNIGKTLRSAFGMDIEYLLLAGGQLESEYSAVAPLTIVKDPNSLAVKIRDLCERGFMAAIVNTTVSGHAAAMLAANGVNTVLLVHEMPHLLREKRLEASARVGITSAHHVVFPAAFVGHNVIEALGIADSEKLVIRPQGNYKQIKAVPERASELREKLGIKPNGQLVLGVGYADMRKGFDLFLQAWRLLRSSRPNVHFVWVGGIDPGLQEWLATEIAEAQATGTFHMPGFRKDMDAFYSAADAFVLTSREDPFPTVVLEAMSVGVPVIAFDETGGIPEFLIENGSGHVVPYCDVPAMTDKLNKLFRDGIDPAQHAITQEMVERHFAFAPYVRDLLRLALPHLPSVSVAVPNYNYAHCLPERLYTIFDQTHPVEEVLILDDGSSDNSISVIKAVADERKRNVKLIVNKANSGSVFGQWAKAARTTTSEFVWIAEADDLSEPSFLSNMLAIMRTDPSIQIGFCDSKSIDADGTPVYPSYKPYFATIEPNALTRTEVFDGKEFVSRFLSVKNTILNVSSVLWRREALQRVLAKCRMDLAQYRLAGDWRIYLECLSVPGARIAYVADPLNVHRRHAQSVTHSLKARPHVDEISRIHGVINQRFKLPKFSLAAQAAYIEEVAKQLRLVGPRGVPDQRKSRKVRAKEPV
jgi:glycosyltransferase involved in cell wall biosynthesis